MRGYVENDSHLQLKRAMNKEIQKQMYEASEYGYTSAYKWRETMELST